MLNFGKVMIEPSGLGADESSILHKMRGIFFDEEQIKKKSFGP
ncbi:MAG: hypothetical protein CM15mP111_4610 [Hyphomicrobiales bacterium]|nr:MAG: hypothetical protein CM15mP111_4610 [Hyphomicrobiales bacterium]